MILPHSNKGEIISFIAIGALIFISAMAFVSSLLLQSPKKKLTMNSMAMFDKGDETYSAPSDNTQSSGTQQPDKPSSTTQVQTDQSNSDQHPASSNQQPDKPAATTQVQTDQSNSEQHPASSNQQPDKPSSTTQVQTDQSNSDQHPASSNQQPDKPAATTQVQTDQSNSEQHPASSNQQPDKPSSTTQVQTDQSNSDQHPASSNQQPDKPAATTQVQTDQSNNLSYCDLHPLSERCGGTSTTTLSDVPEVTPVPTSPPQTPIDSKNVTSGNQCKQKGDRSSDGQYVCYPLDTGGPQWVGLNQDLWGKTDIGAGDILSGAADPYQRFIARNTGYNMAYKDAGLVDKGIIGLLQGSDFVSQFWNSATNRITGGKQTNTFEEYANAEIQTSADYAKAGIERPNCFANPISAGCAVSIGQSVSAAILGGLQSTPLVGKILEDPLNSGIDAIYSANPQERQAAHAATSLGSETAEVVGTIDLAGAGLEGLGNKLAPSAEKAVAKTGETIVAASGEDVAAKTGNNVITTVGNVLKSGGNALRIADPQRWPIIGPKLETFVQDAPITNKIVEIVQANIPISDKLSSVLVKLTDLSSMEPATKLQMNKAGYELEQAGFGKVSNIPSKLYDAATHVEHSDVLKGLRDLVFPKFGLPSPNSGQSN